MFNLKEKFLSLFGKKISCIYLNGTITVTLLSKKKVVFTKMTKSEYEIISKFTTDEEVQDYYDTWVEENYREVPKLIDPQPISKVQATKEAEVQHVADKKEYKKIAQNFDKLVDTGDFEVKDGELYLKPINLSMPKLLVTKFLGIIDAVLLGEDEDKFEEYHALKNFWKWCSLCHNPQSREDLFRYLEVQGLEVNKYGFFFAYRKVRKVSGSGDTKDQAKTTKGSLQYVKFISDSYVKIKTQKKAPKNFTICKGIEEFSCILTSKLLGTEIQLGNLMDLYNGLGDPEVQEQMFTDDYTHSFDIRIGKEVKQDPEKCDTNRNADCSTGLHVGAKDYGCGDTRILVIVNPMNSISVPASDGHKMRVSAYFPVAILENTHKFNFHLDENVLDLGTEYFNDQLEKLNSLVKNNTPVELVKHRLIGKDITKAQVDHLEFTITQCKEIIANRVVNS